MLLMSGYAILCHVHTNLSQVHNFHQNQVASVCDVLNLSIDRDAPSGNRQVPYLPPELSVVVCFSTNSLIFSAFLTRVSCIPFPKSPSIGVRKTTTPEPLILSGTAGYHVTCLPPLQEVLSRKPSRPPLF